MKQQYRHLAANLANSGSEGLYRDLYIYNFKNQCVNESQYVSGISILPFVQGSSIFQTRFWFFKKSLIYNIIKSKIQEIKQQSPTCLTIYLTVLYLHQLELICSSCKHLLQGMKTMPKITSLAPQEIFLNPSAFTSICHELSQKED